MNTNDLKTSILSLGDANITRDQYHSIQSKVLSVLGCDASMAFSDAIDSDGEQLWIENPDDLVGLWRRMVHLAKQEGKV